MAAAVRAHRPVWSVGDFFPPQPLEIPESPLPAAIAHRLWGDECDTCGFSAPSPVAVPAEAHLDASDADHTLLAAQRLVQGGLVMATINGYVVCLADADRPDLLPVLASISGRPQEEATLLCAPEWVSEHVDMEALAKSHSYANIMKFNQDMTSLNPVLLGLKLPANAECGAPQHLVHDGVVVTMWMEHKAIRDIFTHVRYSGERALMAVPVSSSDFQETLPSHGIRLTFLHDSLPHSSPHNATLLDFSGERPLLTSQGATSVDEIQQLLLRWNLGSV